MLRTQNDSPEETEATTAEQYARESIRIARTTRPWDVAYLALMCAFQRGRTGRTTDLLAR